MGQLRVVLSAGHGKLYLHNSARYFAKRGIHVEMIMGWVPRDVANIWVRVCSFLVGRNLAPGLKQRIVTEPNVITRQCPFAEVLINGGFLLAPILGCSTSSTSKIARLGWQNFGRTSRKFIRNADILHVRSGAGQGGAIQTAKKRGMKVLVDHSIAHPKFMESNLKSEYAKNGQAFTMGPKDPFWEIVIQDCLDADRVLVNSDFVRSTFLEAGFPSEKIRVVVQGSRPDFYSLREKKTTGALRLLFTGGFGFRKGAEYLLEALAMLQPQLPGIALDVVGSFDEAKPLMSRFRGDALPVRFHGPVPQDALKKFLRESDVYVFPSLAEGCASSGLEAMSAGLCVLATEESGLPIADGKTGFFVPTKDAKAIAEKIMWLSQHREVIDSVGANAANLISSQYTWEKYAENVEKVYLEMLR